MRRLLVAPVLLVAGSASISAQQPAAADRPGYLYVWATAMDTAPTMPDTSYRPRRLGVFLAAVDLRDGSPTRGRVVQVVTAADTAARLAHHTEHALAADGVLFANDFGAGRTYRFDLRTPGAPRLIGDFTTAGPYAYPHSFVRLANGHVLATYQRQSTERPPGGLVELARDGTAIRWTSAGAAGVDSAVLQPYSLEVIPSLDRVVTTSTSMTEDVGVHVQVWRLSDLRLLHTLAVPEAPNAHPGHAMQHRSARDTSATEVHHLFPGEPRLLADGHSVMLGTFTCGVYLLTGIDGASPRLSFAGALPGGNCAVPARIGQWWVQTVPSLHGIVSLDVSDPAHPREVSRLAFAADVRAHWLSADASGSLLALDSGLPTDPRVYLVALDRRTGALARDARLPVIDLSRVDVPGLGIVRAAPHGAVFGPAQDTPRDSALVVYRVTPSSVDPAVRRFDEPHLVVFDPAAKPDAPLLVFLPGTGGRPQNTSDFARVAARQGYRVIGLEYVDLPAVAQICPRDPDPNCSEKVRRKRIYGDDVTSLVDDKKEESIVERLTTLLAALDRDHPAEGWGQYLDDGRPNWPRIAVSGLSQGAGMAAYIAQHTRVARVVLFSSPWDNYGRARTLAPWVTRGNGKTPAELWYGAYHRNEETADIIARAYSALHIPRDHVQAFTLEPAGQPNGPNPYHASVVANGTTPRAADGTPAYAEAWRTMLGPR